MITNNNLELELQARPELIGIITQVSKDKGISLEEVFSAMEIALKKVANNIYGNLYDIRAKINKLNGAIVIQRVFTVVEEVENFHHEISFIDAKKKDSNVQLGDEITENLPPIDFSRTYVQAFRQIVNHKVKEAEKEREYLAYKDKVGEIVSGVVKRVEFNSIFVELTNKAEAYLRRDRTIPRENIEVGNRIRALILEVKRDLKSSQIILSRYHSGFIKKLFQQEIPEIYEGIIEIKAISRDAGSRSKLALVSKDPSIDPIATSVGFRGSRIQGVLSELKGEKIDLVLYSENIANFVINAFHPTEILKVIVDEDKKTVGVVAREENLSLAIGRRGQNISLISKLVGWHIDLMSEEVEKEKRQKYTQEKMSFFMESLDVDDMISQLLVLQGVETVEEILEDNAQVLRSIGAFNEDIIEELKERANVYIKAKEAKIQEEILSLGVDSKLLNFKEISSKELLMLAKNEVKSLSDLADLSAFDLQDILVEIDLDKANTIIMLAREST